MENQSEVSGYVASTLVLLTFVAKDMRLLRTIAHLRHDRVAAGRAFSAHGVATEHRSTCRDRQGSLSHGRQNPSQGAVRAQTLCTGMTARDQSPVAPWPIFLRTAEDSAPSLTNPTNQVIGRSVRALSSPAGYQGEMGRRCTGLCNHRRVCGPGRRWLGMDGAVRWLLNSGSEPGEGNG